jgi:N-glycosylase/DNA lyase
MEKAILLNTRETLDLTPTSPFNFDATLHKPDHFPTSDHLWEPGVRWQTMRWQDAFLGLKFENRGSIEQPKIALSVFSESRLKSDFLDVLVGEIHYRYNLQMDLAAFNSRFRADPGLESILQRWYGMRPLNCNSLYEYLIIAIVLQNTLVRRSVSMMRALFENYGTPLLFDSRVFYSFWKPADLDGIAEEELRRLKVGYRAKSIKRVSQAFAQNTLDEPALRGLPCEEQRKVLLRLYGIGPASVGYLLSAVFHHLDEMNHISPWEQKIYSRLFFEREPEDPVPVDQLIAYFSEKFSGYRMLAVHYVWEDLWWRRKNEPVEWLEKLIRL